ncbi:helix-turn-helix domain-containing protein, partial [Candidatus Gracilibacteria bacterium]|nr:helix-turn-helix domain-containing protein [Candidatus Gracilibacteria bacterium]
MSYFSDFGLSGKEETVYLTCLTLGASPASIIAEKVGLKRPTTYLLLESLVKQGYISQSSRNGVIQFSAVDPDDLAEVFLQKHRQMSNKIQFFRESIPELRALESKRTDLPKIRLFTGKEAVRKVYDSLFDAPEWCSFFDISVFEKTHSHDDLEKIVWDIGREIVAKKKKARDIFVDCPLARNYRDKIQSENYEVRLIPKGTQADSIFFEDTFFLISYADNMQLLEVQNTILTNMQRTMFEGLWKSLETK